MGVMDIRQLEGPRLVHEEGEGWVRLTTGDTDLVIAFNASNDLKTPTIEIGIKSKSGVAPQVLRYDYHESGPHMHHFGGGWQMKVPLFVGRRTRLAALLGLFHEFEARLCQDLVEVGHSKVAEKLTELPEQVAGIAWQIQTILQGADAPAIA
jgi:hypothetical protein